MTKRTRTFLFILMLITFAVISPSIIMYSQGYRFDIKKMQYLETGGIYVKTYPGDANISIDDKYENKTSGFSRDLLIQNLLPENHTIKIEKEGYHPWTKNLSVEQKKVAEAKYVILFPNDIPFKSIDTDVKSFYGYNNKILILTIANELFSYDSETGETTKILSKTQTPLNISDITFSNTNRRALIKTTTGLHYLLNLETSTISLIKAMSSKTQNVIFDPSNEGSLFFQENGLVYRVNADKQTVKIFKKEKVQAFTVNQNDIYFLENGLLSRDNTLLNTNSTLSETSFELSEKSSYQLVYMENEIFLIENKKIVYLFNKETKLFDKKIEAKKELKYTPFYDRIAFASNNELWLLILKDTETPFFEKAYSVLSITNFPESLNDIKWLNGDYFVYSLNGKLSISEIDNRDNINSFELPYSETSKVFFNGSTKKLFILNNEELLTSEEKIMP